MKIDERMTLESMSQALWYNRWTLNKFQHVLTGDILEVGCGIGNFTKTLTEYGDVWAIDNNEHHLTITKKKNIDAHIGKGDIEKGTYFFKKKSFNTIVCLNVLEHIESDSKALNHMASLLKKNGHLVLLVPVHSWLYSTIDQALGHHRRYNPKTICTMLKKSGFSLSFTRIINFLGAFGWFFAGKIRKHKIVSQGNIKRFNTLAPIILPIEDIIAPPIGTSILVIAQKT
jgi:ubiquinone/menaquinone biosynthesis C-methylase UbiE